MKRWLLWIGLALTLTGCATPRFEISVSYIPPQTEAGLACIAACSEQLAQCQTACAEQFESCRLEVEPDVQSAFQEALERYELQRQQYLSEVRFYEINRALNWSFGYRRGCYHPYWGFYHPCYDGFWGWGYYGYWERPPIPPEAPNLDRIREQIIAQRCNSQCDCQSTYEQCYLNCGGQIIREERCVANCPVNNAP